MLKVPETRLFYICSNGFAEYFFQVFMVLWMYNFVDVHGIGCTVVIR